MDGDEQVLVTLQDLKAGFKDVEVELRDGTKETVRLKALPWRAALGLMAVVQERKDPGQILLGSLPEGKDETWMNSVLPFDAARLMTMAWGINFGLEAQKKMLEAGRNWAEQQIPILASEPSLPSSASVTPPARSNSSPSPS